MKALQQANMSAESIAHALPGCRRIRADKYLARCPAHDDSHPSLAITQKGDRVLLICRAGCSQREVIAALQRLRLWPEKRTRTASVHSLTDKRTMRAFVAGHEHNLRRGIPTSTKHQRLCSQYQRVLCAPLSPGEVVEGHFFCLQYSAAVRRGETPGAESDSRFLRISRIVRDKAVPYEW